MTRSDSLEMHEQRYKKIKSMVCRRHYYMNMLPLGQKAPNLGVCNVHCMANFARRQSLSGMFLYISCSQFEERVNRISR